MVLRISDAIGEAGEIAVMIERNTDLGVDRRRCWRNSRTRGRE
jgi:hypothetical protein